MKICVISNLYPPFVRGGAELVAAMQAEGFKKAWQHVFVISTRPANIKVVGRGPLQTGLWTTTVDRLNDIDIYRFNPVNLYYYLNDHRYPGFVRLLWHLFDAFNLFSYFKVKKILLREKPDLVITHNLMGLGFLTPYLIRKLKIKHIHTVHDVQLVTPSGLIVYGQENSWQNKFFKIIGYTALMRRLMGSPDIVVSPSRFLLDFYQQSNFFAKSKKKVIPNPIKNLIKLKKRPGANLELLYLGQVHEAKGILGLIKSFRNLKLPYIRLHIVGVGTALAKAKELAKDDKRIKFYGWMPHNKLLPLLSKMDVLVVPSMCYENSPTVIYESLAMGTPVLAADIGGTAELIKEGVNGWAFPAGDFEMLKKKIISLYKQREKIKLMAPACQQSIAQYKLDKYTDRILSLVNDNE